MNEFSYEGRVYVRPIGRGIVLIDGPSAGSYFEAEAPEGYFRLKATLEPLSDAEDLQAREDHHRI